MEAEVEAAEAALERRDPAAAFLACHAMLYDTRMSALCDFVTFPILLSRVPSFCHFFHHFFHHFVTFPPSFSLRRLRKRLHGVLLASGQFMIEQRAAGKWHEAVLISKLEKDVGDGPRFGGNPRHLFRHLSLLAVMVLIYRWESGSDSCE